MPKYQRSNGKRPYRRKFKHITSHRELTHLLSNLPLDFWNIMQQTALDLKGTKLQNKVKPSAFGLLAESKYPQEFNQFLTIEDREHNNPESESHKGGGLNDAANQVLSSLWDQLKTLPGGETVTNLIYKPDQGMPLLEYDRMSADFLRQSYNRDTDTREKTVHGYVLVPRFSDDFTAVYWNPATNSVQVSIRGSKSAKDWLVDDVGILLKQKPTDELINKVKDTLLEISKEFPESEKIVNSHSLSGSVITNIFQSATQDEKRELDTYKKLNYFNPGGSPLADQSSIKNQLLDPRVQLFVNRSDLISQTYIQNRQPTTYTVYADASTNPLSAHGLDQWVSDNPEFDKEVSFFDNYTEFNNSAWTVGGDTENALENI